MKKRISSKVSKTDWKALRALKEHQIKLSKAHSEIDLKHEVRGQTFTTRLSSKNWDRRTFLIRT